MRAMLCQYRGRSSALKDLTCSNLHRIRASPQASRQAQTIDSAAAGRLPTPNAPASKYRLRHDHCTSTWCEHDHKCLEQLTWTAHVLILPHEFLALLALWLRAPAKAVTGLVKRTSLACTGSSLR